MTPKIIIVQGLANSGKTTEIKKAMNGLGVFISSAKKDVLVSAHLHIQGAGYAVGFASGGDSAAEVRKNINFFSPKNLSHMVFACRSRGGGIVALRNYAARIGAQTIVITAPDPQLAAKIIAQIP